jgi:transcription initiation factor TFIID TATA-box-binding protein
VTKIEVANIVGAVNYQQRFDLGALEEDLRDRDEISEVVYKPSENHWLQTWFNPDDTYAAFYQSGQCSIAGCKSVEDFYETSGTVNSVLGDMICRDIEPRTSIKSIVAVSDTGTSIPLEALAIELGLENAEYEPEQFPALIYRDSDHVVLVFSSGKLLCTGLTSLDRVSEAVEDIIARIEPVL